MKAILYDRVSTDRQGDSGLGQDAQRAQMLAYCQFKGWDIVAEFSDVVSSKKRRPGLEDAVAWCANGDADVLVAAKLSRISRGVIETLEILERSHRERWGIVALDLDIDTTTPTGKLLASLIASVNEYERNVIGERTRDALAAAKAKGTVLGRRAHKHPAMVTVIARDLLRSFYAATGSYQEAAALANVAVASCPRPNGKPWTRAAVYQALQIA